MKFGTSQKNSLELISDFSLHTTLVEIKLSHTNFPKSKYTKPLSIFLILALLKHHNLLHTWIESTEKSAHCTTP